MEQKELDTRFTYHAPKQGQPETYELLRGSGKSFSTVIEKLCPESREKSLAITKIEEAVFWANAAIARRG